MKKSKLTFIDLPNGTITDVNTMETRQLTEQEKQKHTDK